MFRCPIEEHVYILLLFDILWWGFAGKLGFQGKKIWISWHHSWFSGYALDTRVPNGAKRTQRLWKIFLLREVEHFVRFIPKVNVGLVVYCATLKDRISRSCFVAV